MGDFLAELLTEFIIGPIVRLLFGAVLWLFRTGAMLLLYPLLLLMGWLRLWLRERGRIGFERFWQVHGPDGLHRFGWQETALDVECLVATGLIALAGGGVVLAVASIVRQLFL